MPTVFIPPPLRSLTDGKRQVEVAGANVLAALEDLDRRFPGVLDRVVEVSGPRPVLRAGLQISVGSEMVAQGLRQAVNVDDEIHILPAIGGG